MTATMVGRGVRLCTSERSSSILWKRLLAFGLRNERHEVVSVDCEDFKAPCFCLAAMINPEIFFFGLSGFMFFCFISD